MIPAVFLSANVLGSKDQSHDASKARGKAATCLKVCNCKCEQTFVTSVERLKWMYHHRGLVWQGLHTHSNG